MCRPVFAPLPAIANWTCKGPEMKTHKLPVNLTDEQIEDFGRELDAIRDEILDSRGERDRAYILKVIKTQRSMALGARVLIYASLFFLPAWGHALAVWPVMLTLLGLGTFMLGIAKILENMEIAHNDIAC